MRLAVRKFECANRVEQSYLSAAHLLFCVCIIICCDVSGNGFALF